MFGDTQVPGIEGYAYADNAAGPFVVRKIAERVMDPLGHFLRPGTISVCVDPEGRPSIVYIDVHDWPSRTSLWYVAGPGAVTESAR